MALTIIFIAILGIVSLQIGYTIQKLGVHTLFERNYENRSRKQDKNFWYWVIGTIITFFASILVFYALSEGEISVIQPLTGIGPIILALIVTYYLNESLKMYEWTAIMISSSGVVLLSIISSQESRKSELFLGELDLFIVTALIIGIVTAVSLLLIKANFIKLGVVEGLAAGTIGGMPSLFAKLAVPRALQLDILHWSIIMLLIAQFITFYLLQRGFHVSKAAIIASLFTATSILLPVGLAVIFFNETVSLAQLLAMSLIILGAILMSRKQEVIEATLGEQILPFAKPEVLDNRIPYLRFSKKF
ncbi:MAG: EamA family transporter [Candidatus Hodarchaeales archaeon]|jgi:drug/metabolite transporter (DMT)-like permease